MKTKWAVLCPLLMSVGALAAESDYFTGRQREVIEVAKIINETSNAYIAEALLHLNATMSCDDGANSELALYGELAKYFSNHKTGKLVQEILYANQIEKTVIPLRESVYEHWKWNNGYLLGTRNAEKSPLAIFPLIKVGDQIVGVDKLEHMFGMGFRYFNAHYLEGKNLVTVLKHGILKEKTVLGGMVLATGVFSYGDLAANFNGMRFWNHMLQKRDDVLGRAYNIGPYVLCQNGQWIKNEARPLDFRNYIDASMDESINCSKFATKGGLRKFQDSLMRLGFSANRKDAACPVSPERLKDIQQKYNVSTSDDKKARPLGHWFINDDGSETVSYLNEF